MKNVTVARYAASTLLWSHDCVKYAAAAAAGVGLHVDTTARVDNDGLCTADSAAERAHYAASWQAVVGRPPEDHDHLHH